MSGPKPSLATCGKAMAFRSGRQHVDRYLLWFDPFPRIHEEHWGENGLPHGIFCGTFLRTGKAKHELETIHPADDAFDGCCVDDPGCCAINKCTDIRFGHRKPISG